ncbi:MAG TPA: hypothetical protein VEB68_01535 [Croceibacterium sp.]|nr:hypothetical protein [Croceibacterium sp.]
MFRLPRRMLEQSFSIFRACGANRRECQVYWASSWTDPNCLTHLFHPRHSAGAYGLAINDQWLGEFWSELASRNLGVRVQVHTHPYEAFHSETDDAFPLLFDVGFLSLVIPNFAKGPVGFKDAYLAEIQADGSWAEVPAASRIVVDDQG